MINPAPEPSRLPITALLTVYGRTLRGLIQQLWPVFIAVIFRKRPEEDQGPNVYINYVFAGIGILTLIVGTLSWFRFRWHLTSDAFIVKRGAFIRKELRLPFDRIQTIELKQPWLFRLLGLARVEFDSAGSRKKEVELWAVNLETAKQVRAYVLSQKQDAEQSETVVTSDEALLELSDRDLIKIGFFQNHFRSIIVFFGIGMGLISELEQLINMDVLEEQYGPLLIRIISAAGIAFFVSGLFLFAAIFYSTINTWMKYYRFKVVRSSEGLKAMYGLINKNEQSIRPEKVQMTIEKAGPVFRYLKMSSWSVVQALSDVAQIKNASFRIPGAPKESIDNMEKLLLSHVNYPVLDRSVSPIMAWYHSVVFAVFPGALMITLHYLADVFSLWMIVLAMVLLVVRSFLFAANFRYGFNGRYIETRQAIWFHVKRRIERHKVQAVHIQAWPMQRKLGLATLKIETAGASLNIPWIPMTLAVEYADALLESAESSKEKWM